MDKIKKGLKLKFKGKDNSELEDIEGRKLSFIGTYKTEVEQEEDWWWWWWWWW